MTDDLTLFTRRLFGRTEEEPSKQDEPAEEPNELRRFTAALFAPTDD